jgi:hypothetical protein
VPLDAVFRKRDEKADSINGACRPRHCDDDPHRASIRPKDEAIETVHCVCS